MTVKYRIPSRYPILGFHNFPPLYMKKIVFTGPESTGKTSITKAVAAYFEVDWVREYARTYIAELDRPYEEADLRRIAKGQVKKEQAIMASNPLFLCCDTSLLVIKIWSDYKYQRCDPWIIQQLQQHLPTLYFLCGTDIPWEYDPLREHPKQRDELFALYRQELDLLKTPYIILKGTQEERLKKVIEVLSIYR